MNDDELDHRLRAWGDGARSEAPTVRVPDRPVRSRAPLLAIAASAAVVAGIVAVSVSVRSDDRPDTGLDAGASSRPRIFHVDGSPRCPDRFDPSARRGISLGWVPHPPSLGGTTELVPPGPSSAVVCRYDAHRLDGRAVDAPDTALEPMVSELNSAPRTTERVVDCNLYLASTDQQNFLIGLAYANDAVAWVSVPGNHCAGSTNGVFRSSANFRAKADRLYSTGRWGR